MFCTFVNVLYVPVVTFVLPMLFLYLFWAMLPFRDICKMSAVDNNDQYIIPSELYKPALTTFYICVKYDMSPMTALPILTKLNSPGFLIFATNYNKLFHEDQKDILA